MPSPEIGKSGFPVSSKDDSNFEFSNFLKRYLPIYIHLVTKIKLWLHTSDVTDPTKTRIKPETQFVMKLCVKTLQKPEPDCLNLGRLPKPELVPNPTF